VRAVLALALACPAVGTGVAATGDATVALA